MTVWKPTNDEAAHYERDGYLVVHGILTNEKCLEARGVVRDTILRPEPGSRADADPMDPMDDSPDARAARFRKLGALGLQSPLLWDYVYTSPQVLAVARHFLGDDLLLKFNSVFLKPAKTGAATPWHQDNGLWRDGETKPFNFWMALDPATRENACLQFIPGSHQTEIVPHVLYQDSIHGELPKERVAAEVEKRGLHHIELAPGDMVIWHSSLWHYSPINTSPEGRIGIAGVVSSPAIAEQSPRFKTYHWLLKGGERQTQFPPETFVAAGEPLKQEPLPKRF